LSAIKAFVYDASKERNRPKMNSASATLNSGPSKPPDSR